MSKLWLIETMHFRYTTLMDTLNRRVTEFTVNARVVPLVNTDWIQEARDWQKSRDFYEEIVKEAKSFKTLIEANQTTFLKFSLSLPEQHLPLLQLVKKYMNEIPTYELTS